MAETSVIQTVVANVSALGALKRVGKILGQSEKLSKFLNTEDFKSIIPSRFRDGDAVEKCLAKLEGGVVINVQEARRDFDALTEAAINFDVEKMTSFIQGHNLPEDVQNRAASQLVKYRTALVLGVKNSAKYKKAFGIEQ